MDTAIGLFKRRHQLKYPQLATLLGISHDYARKLGAGIIVTVSPKLAAQIEERSGGEIKAVELVFPSAAGAGPKRRARRRAGAA